MSGIKMIKEKHVILQKVDVNKQKVISVSVETVDTFLLIISHNVFKKL